MQGQETEFEWSRGEATLPNMTASLVIDRLIVAKQHPSNETHFNSLFASLLSSIKQFNRVIVLILNPENQ